MSAPTSRPPRLHGVRRLDGLTALRSDTLLENSVLLMLVTIVNSLIGLVFWVVAARHYDAAVVGAASVVLSAMYSTALVSDLGFRSLLVHRLASAPDTATWSRYVGVAVAVTTPVSLGVGFLACAGFWLFSAPIGHYLSGWWVIPAVLMSVGSSATLLADSIGTAERRVRGVLGRNTANMVLKLALLVGAVAITPGEIRAPLVATAGAMVLTGAYGVTLEARRLRPGHRLASDGAAALLRADRRELLGHHLINIAALLPAFLIPIEVVAVVGPADTAYLSLAWSIGAVFFLISPAVASALFAHASAEPQAIDALARRSARLIGALLVPAVLGAVALGYPVLAAFGPDYARHGYLLLLVLALSAVPDAITNVHISRARALGDTATGARLNTLMAIVAIALTPPLTWWLGIVGAGLAWLVAQGAGSVVVLVRRRRGTTGRQPATTSE